jgi:hypothetical protein
MMDSCLRNILYHNPRAALPVFDRLMDNVLRYAACSSVCVLIGLHDNIYTHICTHAFSYKSMHSIKSIKISERMIEIPQFILYICAVAEQNAPEVRPCMRV